LELGIQKFADVFRFLRLLQHHVHGRAPGEINVEHVGAAGDCGRQSDRQHNQRSTNGPMPILDEIDVRDRQELEHLQRRQVAIAFDNIKEDSHTENRREHAGDQS
jgi:hypothetical protein